MIYLLYVSSATHLMTDTELVDILRASRQNNPPLDVTGILLYQGGNFIQYLEGPEPAVESVYSRISKDPRHRNILRLSSAPISERLFDQWAMGFQNVEQLSTADQQGFSDFMNASRMPESAKEHTRAITFLRNFRELMR